MLCSKCIFLLLVCLSRKDWKELLNREKYEGIFDWSDLTFELFNKVHFIKVVANIIFDLNGTEANSMNL